MAEVQVLARYAALATAFGLAVADTLAWDTPLTDETAPLELWSHSGDNGPENWGRLSSEFSTCTTGQLQSPISLNTQLATGTTCQPLRFRYRSSSLYATNDGKALRLGYDRGSFLVINGLSYELVEVRFHVPGEHMIDGLVPDGELQLIHGNNRGDIAIVAIPMMAGPRVNRILRRILEYAPSNQGEKYYGRNIGVNALFMMPGRKEYFAYMGSLTRPPCTEGVHWYVMREALEVDAGDLRRLTQLIAPNSRPLQPQNGRTVIQTCAP